MLVFRKFIDLYFSFHFFHRYANTI